MNITDFERYGPFMGTQDVVKFSRAGNAIAYSVPPAPGDHWTVVDRQAAEVFEYRNGLVIVDIGWTHSEQSAPPFHKVAGRAWTYRERAWFVADGDGEILVLLHGETPDQPLQAFYDAWRAGPNYLSREQARDMAKLELEVPGLSR